METSASGGLPPACTERVNEIADFIDQNLKPVTLPLSIAMCVASFVVSVINVVVFTRPCMRSSPLNVLLCALESVGLVLSIACLQQNVILNSFPQCLVYRDCFYYRWFLSSVVWAAVGFAVWMTVIAGAWKCADLVWHLKANLHLTRFKAKAVSLCLAFFCFTVVLTFDLVGLKWVPVTPYLCENTLLYVANAEYKKYWPVVFAYVFLYIPAGCSLLVNCCLVCCLCVRSRDRILMCQDIETKPSFVLPFLMIAFMFCSVFPKAVANAFEDTFEEFLFPLWYLFDGHLFAVQMNILSFFGFYYMSAEFRKTFWSFKRVSRTPIWTDT